MSRYNRERRSCRDGAADSPADGNPADSPAGGNPADSRPAGGNPADSPAGGNPAGSRPAGGSPADSRPAGGSPADSRPADGSPADSCHGRSFDAAADCARPCWRNNRSCAEYSSADSRTAADSSAAADARNSPANNRPEALPAEAWMSSAAAACSGGRRRQVRRIQWASDSAGAALRCR